MWHLGHDCAFLTLFALCFVIHHYEMNPSWSVFLFAQTSSVVFLSVWHADRLKLWREVDSRPVNVNCSDHGMTEKGIAVLFAATWLKIVEMYHYADLLTASYIGTKKKLSLSGNRSYSHLQVIINTTDCRSGKRQQGSNRVIEKFEAAAAWPRRLCILFASSEVLKERSTESSDFKTKAEGIIS